MEPNFAGSNLLNKREAFAVSLRKQKKAKILAQKRKKIELQQQANTDLTNKQDPTYDGYFTNKIIPDYSALDDITETISVFVKTSEPL